MSFVRFFQELVFIVIAALLLASDPALADATTPAPGLTERKPDEPAVALLCGKVVDVLAGRTTGPQTILVRGTRIVALRPGLAPRDGESAVDLSTQTCLPGLIDSHVHLTFQVDAKLHSDLFRLSPAGFALRGVGYARKTLDAGFTTVRNVGDIDNESLALRDAINQGIVEGPRIFSAGRAIGSTGGHADVSNGFGARHQGDPGAAEGIVNSADDAYKSVRQHYKDGADLIKITSTGGVLSYESNGEGPQMRDGEIAAIVAAAHDYGFKVAAHAHGSEGIRRAVRAGVDSIEHGTMIDDALVAQMKQRGTWYVPTLTAATFVADMAEKPGVYPEIIRPKAAALGAKAQGALALAYRGGVKIAFGSDAGSAPHGTNGREFELMAGAGMTPLHILQSATIHAAELLGQGKNLGSLSAGKVADVVAVPGDPLASTSMLRQVSFVMKDGRIVRRP